MDKEIIGWCISCSLVFVSIPAFQRGENEHSTIFANQLCNQFQSFLKMFWCQLTFVLDPYYSDCPHHYGTGCRPCRPASQIAPRELSDCTLGRPPRVVLTLHCRVWLTDCQSLLKGKEWTPDPSPGHFFIGQISHHPATLLSTDHWKYWQFFPLPMSYIQKKKGFQRLLWKTALSSSIAYELAPLLATQRQMCPYG